MNVQTRPRADEFLLALLWLLSSGVWVYFGIIGYSKNVSNLDSLFLPGFVLAYFFLCLAVFGLRFATSVLLRIPRHLPHWMENARPITLGLVLFSGFFFSLFTLAIIIIQLAAKSNPDFVQVWGLVAAFGILILAGYMLLAAINALEPFLFLIEVENENSVSGPTVKTHPLLRWLVGLNSLQHFFYASNQNHRKGDRMHGPLLTEPDLKASVIDEKKDEKTLHRPGLEKTMVGHGGWHVNTLGFTANGSVIFAASTGGVVHFQAGGRKGTMFAPEIKFWEWRTGKVQTAALSRTQTFLTRDYRTPASLHNYNFIVPASGGYYAWVTPKTLTVCNWQSDQVQLLEPETGFNVKGQQGFSPAAFNPDGSKIAWYDPEGQIRYWDLSSDRVQPLRRYPPRKAEDGSEQDVPVWGLVFSPDGTKIAAIAEDGVLLQNVYTGWRWFAESHPSKEKLTGFAFDHNGFQMAVAFMARPEAIRQQRRTRYANGRGNYNNYQSANNFEAGNNDTWLPIVRLWDLRASDYIDLVGGDAPLREVVFSPDDKLLVAVDEAGILRLWELVAETGANYPPRLVAQLDLGMTGRKTVVTFAPDMERLICATDNRVLIWTLEKLRHDYSVPNTITPASPAK